MRKICIQEQLVLLIVKQVSTSGPHAGPERTTLCVGTSNCALGEMAFVCILINVSTITPLSVYFTSMVPESAFGFAAVGWNPIRIESGFPCSEVVEVQSGCGRVPGVVAVSMSVEIALFTVILWIVGLFPQLHPKIWMVVSTVCWHPALVKAILSGQM